MNMNLNASTTVQVDDQLAIFRTDESVGRVQKKVLYVNSSRIFGCELSYMKFFSFKSFIMFIIITGLVAGGYYGYTTMYADTLPDLTVFGGICGVGLLVSFFRAFKKSRHLIIIVEADGMNVITKSRFSFPVAKDIKDKKIEELMKYLVK